MTSLVQRKARTGRDAYAARAMSLGRALRLTAAKQAEQLFDLALATLSITQKAVENSKLEPFFEAEALFLVLEGRGGQVGAAVLEPALVTGLIQQQTMGKVTPAQDGAPLRPSTATDAALCAPFVETLLSRAALLPEEEADRDLLTGYRFGVWVNEARQVLLALQAARYEAIEMTFDLAAGTRGGKLVLLLPEPVRGVDPKEGDDAAQEPVPVAAQKLDKHVMELHAELTIALTRLRLPINQVTAMKVGDVIDLNLSSMAQSLVIDSGGRAITRGTLGQIDGVRALQVEQQKRKMLTEPRRRASDRADLDLPDVTAPVGGDADGAGAPDYGTENMDVFNAGGAYDEEVSLPSISDVDIFGDLGDLPDMPDLEEAEAAADAQIELMRKTSSAGSADEGQTKQAGW